MEDEADAAADADPERPGERTVTVKCSLGRLRITPALRIAIENVAARLQILSARGSLIAAEAVMEALLRDAAPPMISSQTWWYNVLTEASLGRARAPKFPELRRAASKLFAGAEVVDTYLIDGFIAMLAKDMKTAAVNSIKANFHAQISKAIRRAILLWETRNPQEPLPGADEKARNALRSDVTRYAERSSTCSTPQPPWPDAAPAGLRAAVDALIQSWSCFASALPCPKPQFMKVGKMEIFQRWSFALQRQRVEVTRELSSLAGGRDEAIRLLGGLARAVRVVPLWSCHVHAIAIYPTTLKALVRIANDLTNGCKKRKREYDEECEQLDFWSFFPGARRLLGQGSAARLHAFIRTDGITASVNVRRPSSDELPSALRSDDFSDPKLDFGAVRPRQGQRLVAVDPGRRDMITAVVSEGLHHGPVSVADERLQQSISVSTKQYRHNARTAAAARVTRRAYDRQDATLRVRMQALPCSRAYECWEAYLQAAIPLLKDRCEALQATCVRRARFMSYMRRDSELDRICKLLCGTATPQDRQARREAAAGQSLPTLVAFGAANACSTGFGYAPAPQGRLRHRLAKVHGARVTLVDEFRTSRVCSCCGELLECVHRRPEAVLASWAQYDAAVEKKREKWEKRRIARGRPPRPATAAPPRRLCTLVYGVLRCRNCQKTRTGKPFFWHRDENASRNIMAVYLSLADNGKRPTPLSRPARLGSRAHATEMAGRNGTSLATGTAAGT